MNPDEIRGAIREYRPVGLVNAAAYTAVDKAEQESGIALKVNAEAPAIMADEAKALDIPLIHYSTDYVFDGVKKGAYIENDEAKPLSVYGKTKLAGEEAIRASGAKGAILRTSWVFGEVGNNFVRTILRLGSERDSLRVVSDQVGAPTPAALLADVTAHISRHLDKGTWSEAEVFHVAAVGPLSWHEFARVIVSKASKFGLPLRLVPDAIEAIPSESYVQPAMRPKNSTLDCSKVSNQFGLVLPSWEPYLERMLLRIVSERTT